MAPELALHDYTQKSDLWSLGITICAMLCGIESLPFDPVSLGCPLDAYGEPDRRLIPDMVRLMRQMELACSNVVSFDFYVL
jgi:serine/threonine protein kinase